MTNRVRLSGTEELALIHGEAWVRRLEAETPRGATKRSHISDVLVCGACLASALSPMRQKRSALEILECWTGAPTKVVWRAMERARDRGLLDHGLGALAWALPAPEGRRLLLLSPHFPVIETTFSFDIGSGARPHGAHTLPVETGTSPPGGPPPDECGALSARVAQLETALVQAGRDYEFQRDAKKVARLAAYKAEDGLSAVTAQRDQLAAVVERVRAKCLVWRADGTSALTVLPADLFLHAYAEAQLDLADELDGLLPPKEGT